MLYNKSFQVNPLGENCYVVSDDTGEAVIIDCGCFTKNEWNNIKAYIDTNNLKPVHLLDTHLHFDHCLGNHFVKDDYGLYPEANDKDLFLYNNMENQLYNFFMECNIDFTMPPLAKAFSDNDTITFGNHKLKVMTTPGHSPGSVVFYCEEEDMLWSGDTVFMGSVGRCDLEGGNYKDMLLSISNKIKTLPPSTVVFPGHGPSTTIADEMDYNPYF